MSNYILTLCSEATPHRVWVEKRRWLEKNLLHSPGKRPANFHYSDLQRSVRVRRSSRRFLVMTSATEQGVGRYSLPIAVSIVI